MIREVAIAAVGGFGLGGLSPASAQYYGSSPSYGTNSYNQYGGSYGSQQPYGQNQYQQPYGQQPYGSPSYRNQQPYGSSGYGNTQPGAYSGGNDWQRDMRRQERRADRQNTRIDIENALQQRGYDVGRIDGNIDEQSRAAIRQYQTDAGLPADGKATQELLAHIETNNVRASSNFTPGQAAGALVDRFLNR
jgi:hypothetical protein